MQKDSRAEQRRGDRLGSRGGRARHRRNDRRQRRRARPTTSATSRRRPVSASSSAALGGRPVRLEAEQVAQVDSKDMDFALWRRLADRGGAPPPAARSRRRRDHARHRHARGDGLLPAPHAGAGETGRAHRRDAAGHVAAGRRPAEPRRCDRGRAHAGGARRARRDGRFGPPRRRRPQGARVPPRCVLVGRCRAARTGRGRAAAAAARLARRAAARCSTSWRSIRPSGRGLRSSRPAPVQAPG